MKLPILPLIVVSAILLSSGLSAQKNTAFAVTASTKGTFTWNVIRLIDIETGAVVKTIYDPAANETVRFSAVAGSTLRTANNAGSATGSGVAATAYDANHNRLYFTNMKSNELMYFDLSKNEPNVVVNSNPAFNTGDKFDEANVITRMAFASDGFGYAITNDGKSFIKFTTDQKPAVSNLGELIDGKNNGKISIHSQCSSWGGDMVGDVYGNLYLVSYRNHVFKINPKTRIADYEGQIKDLPAEFTSNGVVVNNDGEVIVSSAITSDNYYKVNMSTLKATPLHKAEETVFNSSDLANSNLLFQRKKENSVFVANEVKGNDALSVYPNPVPNKTFAMQFDKVPAGKYQVLITDATGRNVLARSLNVSAAGQIEKIKVPSAASGGLYLMKVIGSGNTVYNNTIVFK